MSNNPPYSINPQWYPHQQQPRVPQQSDFTPILLPTAHIPTGPSYKAHAKAEAMADLALKFSLAMHQADRSIREGPWYGVWNLTLNEFSVVEHGDVSMTISVIYPEFPVTAIWDLGDPEELNETWNMDVHLTSSPDPMDLLRTGNLSPTESHGLHASQQFGQTVAEPHVAVTPSSTTIHPHTKWFAQACLGHSLQWE